MIAVLSDIHANLEALEAVLRDIDQYPIITVYCLGDTVGYGPNPCECLDLAMRFDVVLLGNCDQDIFFDQANVSDRDRRSLFWSRDQIENATDPNAVNRREYLAELPRIHREEETLYVHGSPRNPLNEYVFPEDIYNQRKMERIFQFVDKYCFNGHTHIPGVITEDMTFVAPEEDDFRFVLDHRKTIVNVGSVGQPRDLDRRACYVIADDQEILFRRVRYDWNKTIRKIHEIDGE